jgi:hypothetical protein
MATSHPEGGPEMSTSASISTRPYVVPEGTPVPQPEARSGWVTFAGVMFLVSAFANLFWGLAALDAKSYLAESGLLYGTLETWGWIALGWSAVVLIGAFLIFARTRPGPIVGVVLASISCIFWLFALPVMPLFAMTVMLIDAFIIYGLVTYGMER